MIRARAGKGDEPPMAPDDVRKRFIRRALGVRAHFITMERSRGSELSRRPRTQLRCRMVLSQALRVYEFCPLPVAPTSRAPSLATEDPPLARLCPDGRLNGPPNKQRHPSRRIILVFAFSKRGDLSNSHWFV